MIFGPHGRLHAALAVLVAVTGATATSAHAGEMVEFDSSAGKVKAYLAAPEGDAPAPAIVVIHEWWGLTDWIKENADRFAERGYIALAVDLYNGKATDDAGEAHELMRALDQAEGVSKLKAAVAFLEAHPRVQKDKPVGSIGWCMGGGYSRQLAQASKQVGPTVICYGSVATDPEQLQALSGKPILGIFGGTDRGIPVDQVKRFAEAAGKAGSEVELHIYEDAGHAFMRPGGSSYVKAATDQAWKEIDAFFAEHLK